MQDGVRAAGVARGDGAQGARDVGPREGEGERLRAGDGGAHRWTVAVPWRLSSMRCARCVAPTGGGSDGG